jgi:hypothetical protein
MVADEQTGGVPRPVIASAKRVLALVERPTAEGSCGYADT